jgi:aminomethyltransferase
MTESQGELQRTPLFDLHRECGAKFAPFAGYEMPVQYPSGILGEHTHTRSAAGLFDVSHMGQVILTGAGAATGLEAMMPIDVVGLGVGRQRYALFTNADGGILDDLMVTNLGDRLFLVVNAACKAADIAHLQANLPADCALEVLADRALLALQGPAAASVLARFAPETATQGFMAAAEVEIDGAACLVSRSGYSGEDGYEISMPAETSEAIARRLLAEEEVAPIGLGARDSLRLEAGLCLYGADRGAQMGAIEGPARRRCAAGRISRRRGHPRAAGRGRAAQAGRLEAGGPGAGARRRRAGRRRGPPGRVGHQRRLRPHGGRAGRHGLS